MKNIFVVLLISMLCLSGCTGDRCIDADDFGFLKFVVSSRYKQEDLAGQQQNNQTAPWINSEYYVNGQPLTMLVKTWDLKKGDKNNSTELSAWCAWYGGEKNTNTLSEFCKRLQVCEFTDCKMCTPTKDAKINNPPCLFKNGVGLYMLIADRDTDPNISRDTQRTPLGITAHLGEPTVGYELYDLDKRGDLVRAGGINYQYEGNNDLRVDHSQCPLYFKILDKFYDDNNGQYRITIKSGVSDTRPDPLEFLTNLIKAELFGDDKNKGVVRSIYEGVINTPGYRVAVSALLTIYIMFTGASFLIGNTNLTHTELIVRILKISVVSTLLSSTNSWQFFHDYLFTYFVEGLAQILQIIKETGNSGPGSSSIIGLMIAPQTMAKLFSLLFSDKLGFIYILLFLIALYFIFMLVFKATIIYLTALITIGMIIIMAPIFICFMLFDITKSLFENWLKQLITYALQPIILFTGLAFISMIIRTEIYGSLGFAVCKYDFPDLGPINELFGSFTEDLDVSIGDSIFYWWFPSPMKSSKFTRKKANILVPMDHRVDDGSEDGKLCLAYECIENRYIELPFLDPIKDATRIGNFFSGTFVQLDGLLLIFVCIYLLSKFNDIAVSSAKFLAGTSGSLTNIQAVGHNAYAPIAHQINRPANYVATNVKQRANKLADMVTMYPAKAFEGYMMGRVSREALKSPSSSVLNEVKRNYGIDHKDVNVKADEDYKEGISSIIKMVKPGISKDELSKQAGELAGKGSQELRANLAELKFGKDTKITEEQWKEIDKLMKTEDKNGKSLRELASDAKFTRAFQQAYVNSHQEMSSKGIGLLGKNISPLRSWQEMNNRVDSKRKLRDDKRHNIGERLYAGYEGLKRGALTAIVGKDLRDAFEGNLTGAEYHDFEYNDPRLRTYSESLEDDKRLLKFQELRTTINKETIATGTDISSPEYLARLEQQNRKADIEYYEKLSDKKLAYEVYNALATSEDPVLMGDRFMREKATDMQSRKMIDDAHKVEQEMINDDRYISRKDRYEIVQEKATQNINDKTKMLEEHYKTKIPKENLPETLAKYYAEKPDVTTSDAEKEVGAVISSINNLDYSEKVLSKIERRKAFIQKEVKTHIDRINGYRLEAKMTEYETV
jgi:type IV secretion system protein VirB6